MTAPTLSIATSDSAPPSRTPHLMPFHMKHTGFAPVSTYFHVKPGPSTDAPNQAAPADPTGEKENIQEGDLSVPQGAPVAQSTYQRISATAKRFVSAFRGRTIHGVEIALPSGYTGLVLRGDRDLRGKVVTSVPSKSAGGRSSRRKAAQREEEEAEEAETNDEPVRVLKPSAQFSSFVLWHPDRPVDEGRDEYLRSLTEWIDLAAEVHRVEE
ncbi:ribonuclease H1 small subunit [Auriscalpium vulgare]|uniref:Ribonuclease H1 small subunit n=1 Tax=Auriscalpium vulgare TaxID=40419 RepID=A0ACB8RUU4_9AGAM|nr:ribonuclease H1 small subunit [Auriscalpium vulgare]